MRLQTVAELCNLAPDVADVSESVWRAALSALHDGGRSCLPSSLPAGGRSLVVSWPSSSMFCPLLEAASEFVKAGGQHAAERVAQEARLLKAFTTVAYLRHYRQPAPPAEAGPEALFAHERIGLEGNGYLAVAEGELTAATGAIRKRGILRSRAVPNPSDYVVVWADLSAPALIIGGVHLAYADPDHGAALLHGHLNTAAQALVPGPRDVEWP
ncbi:hypothetical protein [Streptomyces sp. NPDC054865]